MESTYALLARLADEEYFPAKIPAVEDSSLAAAMMNIDTTESFEELAANIDLDIGRVLKSFAFRMATLALRSREPAPIVPGLIAAQFSMMVDDFRDVLPSYAALYRSAEEIGLDAKAIFLSASLMPREPGRQTPAQFAGRKPALRGIAAMGLSLINGPDGYAYGPKS